MKSFLTRPEDGTKSMPVGLASVPSEINFQCGTCMYFSEGECHNENPALYEKPVQAEWCCNLFDRDDMIVVIK